MIYDALLVPTESPSTLREIKRALLTYDKVFLPDPSDRDLLPSNGLQAAMGIPMMAVDMGPIRPLAKSIGYDDIYEKIYDQCKPAVKQGLIEVVSTFTNKSRPGTFSLGFPDLGGYPLNLSFVFSLYRSIAAKPDMLLSAVKQDLPRLLNSFAQDPSIAAAGMGDATIGSSEPMPHLTLPNRSQEINRFLTLVARGRIASFIKFAGYCELKQLIPCFPQAGYGGILSGVVSNTRSVLADIEDDLFWSRRNRVLDICHQEFMNDETLDSMSISEVISLRSKAWGSHAAQRERLFEVIFDIAASVENEQDFGTKVQSKINEYRKQSRALEQERENIQFKIKCEVGKSILAGGVGLAGLMSQTQSPLASMGLTLAAGGIFFFEKSKEYVPFLRSLKEKEQDFRKGAGFGISNFYSSFRKS